MFLRHGVFPACSSKPKVIVKKQKVSRNEELWDQLVQHGVLCSQPKLELTIAQAQQLINKHNFYKGDFRDKKVLCLASGGGQQSIAFALLGAQVTVVDFSAEQLKRDHQVAKKYEQPISIVKSDMRDLSFADNDSFDLVYQPYSINYIPRTQEIFDEVTRVLKPGGYYDLMLHNPYVHGTWKDGCWGKEWAHNELWRGKGYPLWQPYRDGYPIQTDDGHWNFFNAQEEPVRVPSPQEYRHTLSTVLNALLQRGLDLCYFGEEKGTGFDHEPGTWEHYQSCAPPWLYIISRKRVDA